MPVTAAHRHGLVRAALVAVMAVGSLALWTAVPAACLWAASKLTGDRITFYAIVLLTAPLLMLALGWCLYRVNAVYVRLGGGQEESGHAHTGWLKSLSDDRRAPARPAAMLEGFLAISAIMAIAAVVLVMFVLPPPPGGPPGPAW